jgi:hypothetical protein
MVHCQLPVLLIIDYRLLIIGYCSLFMPPFQGFATTAFITQHFVLGWDMSPFQGLFPGNLNLEPLTANH